MKKTVFKKILCIINYINQQVEHVDLPSMIKQQLAEEKIHLSMEEIEGTIAYIEETEILYHDAVGYDLIPCACVFAKADHGSIAEALAFCECLMKRKAMLDYIIRILKKDPDIDLQKLLDPRTFDILEQTIMLEKNNQGYTLNSILIDDLKAIVQEYDNDKLIISSTLSAIYANSLIHHDDPNIEYRNEDHKMVAYDNMEQLLAIIPRYGIPVNRDVTKPIQSFYKDTLMHEFHHQCPLCDIDIPHMLIASHIKPFRDCAHIYEALDHNNGLLLCRNHDYLFDQGYISFDDDGTILISKELTSKEHMQQAFHISEGWKLPIEYMTTNRKLFMKYHRDHIYKGNE